MLSSLHNLHMFSQRESSWTSDISRAYLNHIKSLKARTTGQAPAFDCVHQQLNCSLPLSASSAGTDSCTAGHIISLHVFVLKMPQKFNGPFPFLSFFTGADRRIVADQIIGLVGLILRTKKPKNVQSSLPLAGLLAGT